MRPFGELISIDSAREIVRRSAVPLERLDRVPLYDARNRVLAHDIVATSDVPPFPRAAMDGYAVHASETREASRTRPVIMRVVDTIYTGQVSAVSIGIGECCEIATGAPLPPGADAVVMVEQTDAMSDGTVRIFLSVQPQQHIGRQGADIRAGQTILNGGQPLTASRIGVIAALGHSEVDVYAKPRVAILSSGNEIVSPGRPLEPGQIYDVNRYTLATIVSEHGGMVVPYGISPDSFDELALAVEACAAEDLVVVSGGSSVGERDLIADVVARRGEVQFHGIAVKPGKPTLFGRIGRTPIFGMSGYPTSCLMNAYELVVPLLRAIARLPPYAPRRLSLPLGSRMTSVAGRHQFLPVRVADGLAVPAFKSSGDITSMSQADGYIEIGADVERVEEGERVEVMLF